MIALLHPTNPQPAQKKKKSFLLSLFYVGSSLITFRNVNNIYKRRESVTFYGEGYDSSPAVRRVLGVMAELDQNGGGEERKLVFVFTPAVHIRVAREFCLEA